MNEKFFEIKNEKQERILNAAIKVFALNGYRKASTDVIVTEAGISKGLLFHYFTNKLSLYEYIIDYSIKYMNFEFTTSVSKYEKDFFELQMMMEQAKIRVMKIYPYMQQFLASLKYETDAKAKAVIGENAYALESMFNVIYKQADTSKFEEYVVVQKVVDMIRWMSDGYLREHLVEGDTDVDVLVSEFSKYLKMLRAHFYRGGLVGVDIEEIK
ncbi:MAG: TetR/AcrR family transcriptional regulator [Lachnospiraceae bacterium]|jgi:TetR/AcrR family transcriptional regulator|nr:TetR/AcrR family transcriptional regulator [Lachnospiraceae bacterium]MCI6331355.1 TetR/AcrR family transcriptional regulator [Lachnospiraceae bacterium]MCI6409281.1 TetR/AcrR family transcriptional regulator [Lachnospiraceae bacterium]MCI6664857.1 TetR/AcrR family transcriptional regulator [Lachnospiraceae bacterium]MCI6977303.1 TetR/AcrR family transcriptional regulator [Lachnospiraceae bacterium]